MVRLNSSLLVLYQEQWRVSASHDRRVCRERVTAARDRDSDDGGGVSSGQMHSRERALDVGLLQSGKFREALEGLLQWLADTEELVANQKPPSADYKVVKAQVQEQRFLKKLLLDRQGSVSSLSEMGRQMATKSSPAERAEIEDQLKELLQRFDALSDQAADRMRQLEDAMKVGPPLRHSGELSGRCRGGTADWVYGGWWAVTSCVVQTLTRRANLIRSVVLTDT